MNARTDRMIVAAEVLRHRQGAAAYRKALTERPNLTDETRAFLKTLIEDCEEAEQRARVELRHCW